MGYFVGYCDRNVYLEKRNSRIALFLNHVKMACSFYNPHWYPVIDPIRTEWVEEDESIKIRVHRDSKRLCVERVLTHKDLMANKNVDWDQWHRIADEIAKELHFPKNLNLNW